MLIHHRRGLLTALIQILILHTAAVASDGIIVAGTTRVVVETTIVITLRRVIQCTVLRRPVEVRSAVRQTGVVGRIMLPACGIRCARMI